MRYRFMWIIVWVVLFSIFLSGCDDCYGPDGTVVSCSELGGNVYAADANARATLQMADANKQATADEQWRQVLKITEAAAEDERLARQTQRAEEATRNAEATAIAQATAVAQATQTAGAVTATAIAQATLNGLAARATDAELAAIERQKADDAAATQVARDYEWQDRQLELERQRNTNKLRAFFWYGVGVVFIALVVVLALSQFAVRGYRDSDGRLQFAIVGLLFRRKLVDPSQAYGAVVDIGRPAPQADRDTLGKIKDNQQKVELVRALPYANAAAQLMTAGSYQIVGSRAEIPPHLKLNPELTGMLEDDWEKGE